MPSNSTDTDPVTGPEEIPTDELIAAFEALVAADVVAAATGLHGWTMALPAADGAAERDRLAPPAEQAIDLGLLALQLGYRPPATGTLG